MNACKTVDDEMRMVCEAKVSRKYLARGVKFTLDYKKPESVTAKSIKKLVKRHLHPTICKHWDYCAKNDT